jgi:hypothetical protein
LIRKDERRRRIQLGLPPTPPVPPAEENRNERKPWPNEERLRAVIQAKIDDYYKGQSLQDSMSVDMQNSLLPGHLNASPASDTYNESLFPSFPSQDDGIPSNIDFFETKVFMSIFIAAYQSIAALYFGSKAMALWIEDLEAENEKVVLSGGSSINLNSSAKDWVQEMIDTTSHLDDEGDVILNEEIIHVT